MRYFLIILLASITSIVYSQKFYKTKGGEIIFSNSNLTSSIPNASSKIRFSAFFHYNTYYHYDINNVFGFFSGYSIRNIGLIYSISDTTFKKRTYTLGIPFSVKIGELNKNNYIFLGTEIEFPFHYKQKMIFGNQKNKYSSWFDSRVNFLFPSIFAGYNFKNGLSFKFKYYFKDFLNKNFKGMDFGNPANYSGITTKLFLVSISYNLKIKGIKSTMKNESNAKYAML
jgi:hypothetical protein